MSWYIITAFGEFELKEKPSNNILSFGETQDRLTYVMPDKTLIICR